MNPVPYAYKKTSNYGTERGEDGRVRASFLSFAV